MRDKTDDDKEHRVVNIGHARQAGALHTVGSIERIAGLGESRAAIDAVLATARRTLRLFDRDLSDPGYRAPARMQIIESFLLASQRNRIRIVLHETRDLDRDCARLMALFRRYAHAFAVHRTVNAARTASDPLLIADEHSFWHRLYHDQPQVVFALGNEAGASPLIHRFEEIWDSSEPAVAATLLGL